MAHPATQPLSAKDGLDHYESGKHRRYTLLFAVNGGAFAIARLWVESPEAAEVVLGSLTLRWLAIGMILFSVVMAADIFMFGHMVRHMLKEQGGPAVFGWQGQVVLILLGALLVVGWFLVGFG